MSVETDRIEADISASRHRLSDTLDALGHKLSPGQMLDEVLGLAQGQAGKFAAKLGTQIRDNPLPTVLIAAGIGMLMMNRRHVGDQMSDDDWHSERRYRALEEARWNTARLSGETDEAYDQRVHTAYARALDMKQMAGEAVHDFQARVSHAVDGARHAATNVRERMSTALSNTSHAMQSKAMHLGHQVSNVRHSAEHLYQDTPLAAGAIALAVGALIGSAAPLSGVERRGLSGVADKAMRTSADLANRAADKASQLSQKVADDVREASDSAIH